MADQDYSKPNPYGKPPKNETLAQKHDRVSKFYSYQKKSDQQAAARGDVTAMDQLMQIGRKASAGGKAREGAALQREGAERKLGINSAQARSQDQANAPGGFNARVAQGGAGALLGEGAGQGAASLIQKLGPLIARMRGGAGQAAGQAMQRPMQQALPRPGMPTRPVPGQGGMPMQRPQGMPMQRPPMQNVSPGQPGQMPGQRPMLPQRPQMAPQPQRALPPPAPRPAGKSLSNERTIKRTMTSPKVSGSKPKSSKDEVGNQRVTGRYSTTPGKTVAQGGKPSQSGVKSTSVRKASTAPKSSKGSQRSGESTKSTASAGTKTAAKKTSTPMKRQSRSMANRVDKALEKKKKRK